jgi:hypothetical protein
VIKVCTKRRTGTTTVGNKQETRNEKRPEVIAKSYARNIPAIPHVGMYNLPGTPTSILNYVRTRTGQICATSDLNTLVSWFIVSISYCRLQTLTTIPP